jgi:dolichyl-phosphate beta-glucosyltransferase
MEESISFVIPAYNEEALIAATLKESCEFFKSHFKRFEVIVIDDGSSDATVSIVLEFMKTVPQLKLIKNERNQGKGFSVRRGIEEADCELILFSDADLSTPLDEVFKLMREIERCADVAIGSRALPESNIIKSQQFHRRNMGKIFNVLVQILLFRGIYDTQCGFKCFRKTAAKRIAARQRLSRFCFDVEMLYIARKMKYIVKETPVRWINREQSRVAVVKDSLNMFCDLFRIRWNAWMGVYAK